MSVVTLGVEVDENVLSTCSYTGGEMESLEDVIPLADYHTEQERRSQPFILFFIYEPL